MRTVLIVGPLLVLFLLFGEGGGGRDTLPNAVAELEHAWGVGWVGGIARMHPPGGRGAFRARLMLVRNRRGWTSGLPRILATRVLEPNRGSEWGRSTHELESGTMHAYWVHSMMSDSWELSSLVLPPPSFDFDRLDDFASAWSRSDPKALRPFCGPRANLRRLARKAEERGWTGRYPDLGEPRLSSDPSPEGITTTWLLSSGRLEATYATPRGELKVRWKVDEASDTWGIAEFRFPD